MLAELGQEVARLQAGLVGHALHLAFAEHILQLLGRDRLIRSVAHPRLCDVAEAGILELRDKAAKTPAHAPKSAKARIAHAAGLLTAAEHAGEDTAERRRRTRTAARSRRRYSSRRRSVAPMRAV